MMGFSQMVTRARARARLLLISGLLAACGPSIHLEGELVIYVAHPGHGGYALLLDSGEERDLIFSSEPDLAPGARLEVWGEPSGDAVKVERYQVLRQPAPE